MRFLYSFLLCGVPLHGTAARQDLPPCERLVLRGGGPGSAYQEGLKIRLAVAHSPPELAIARAFAPDPRLGQEAQANLEPLGGFRRGEKRVGLFAHGYLRVAGEGSPWPRRYGGDGAQSQDRMRYSFDAFCPGAVLSFVRLRWIRFTQAANVLEAAPSGRAASTLATRAVKGVAY